MISSGIFSSAYVQQQKIASKGSAGQWPDHEAKDYPVTILSSISKILSERRP